MSWAKTTFTTALFSQIIWAGASFAETCQKPYNANDERITICDLGVLEGGESSFAKAVSDDGNVVVGYSDSSKGERAFLWTADTGMIDLGTLPGGEKSNATDVSADGKIILGKSDSQDGWQTFIWTKETGMRPLGADISPMAISADGSTIVGATSHPTGGQATALWTAQTGVVMLGTPKETKKSSAINVNNDGTVVVGRGKRGAFRWTKSEGMVFLEGVNGTRSYIATDTSGDGTVTIGTSDGSLDGISSVWQGTQAGTNVVPDLIKFESSPGGISRDGQVIVGDVTIRGYEIAYARTNAEKTLILGRLEPEDDGYVNSGASDIDADGNVIVGNSTTTPTGHHATRWLLAPAPSE